MNVEAGQLQELIFEISYSSALPYAETDRPSFHLHFALILVPSVLLSHLDPKLTSHSTLLNVVGVGIEG